MKKIYTILYCIVFPFFNLVHPNRAIGLENVPQGAVLLCPNHTRMSDPLFVVFALGLKNRPRVLAKQELMRIPVLGWLLSKAGVIGVDRGKSDVTAVKQSLKCLKNGEKLLLFPEGTRHRDGSMDEEGKAGAAMLSLRTGTPILPIYIPADKRWFRRTPVVFGEPYLPRAAQNGRGSSEDYKAIAKDLMGRIAELEALAQ